MTLNDIVEFIKIEPQIRDYSEAQICHSVVTEALKALGWSSRQSDIYSQYPLPDAAVDYCLASSDKNKVFVEVKRPRERLDDHEQQLLNYAFKQGVKIAVLTNGIEWRLYHPLSEGSWSDRNFFRADLSADSIENLNRDFHLFLSKQKVLSGEALAAASEALEKKRAELESERTIPRAWDVILAGPDSLLVDLISETVEEMCGWRPSREQVTQFTKKVRQGTFVPIVQKSPSNTTRLDSASTSRIRGSKTRFAGSISDLLDHGFIAAGQEIFRDHLGKHYTATIDASGHIVFPDGKKFSSISAAGQNITGSSDRGWTLFFTRTSEGQTVRLHDLRMKLSNA